MTMIFRIGAACVCAALASPAAAAVASYDARAFGAFDLVSAVATETGEDALGALQFISPGDIDWKFSLDGVDVPGSDRAGFYRPAGYDLWDGRDGVFARGQADTPGDTTSSDGHSNGGTWLIDYLDENTDVGPIDLTFAWFVTAAADASIFGDGAAQSSANVELAFLFSQGGGDAFTLGASASATDQSGGETYSGTFTVTLAQGDGGLVRLRSDAEGAAEVGTLPAVPLPAALPMLLAGLAGFGLLRRKAT